MSAPIGNSTLEARTLHWQSRFEEAPSSQLGQSSASTLVMQQTNVVIINKITIDFIFASVQLQYNFQ